MDSFVNTHGSGNQPEDRINRIFQFTIDNFREPIKLSQMADIACMSQQSFCAYFKRSTKKTYINFLNEVRVGFACTLLVDTNRPIANICYDSGYNTVANFHKRFLQIKNMTPLKYRESFAMEIIGRGKNVGVAEF